MTAYSYQDWNGLSQDEQSRNPGVSITRDSALNNPNRGVYWSGQSSATALSTHIQDVLTGVGRRALEEQRDTVIQWGTGGITKTRPHQKPWIGHPAGQRLRNTGRLRPRHPDYSDSAGTGRGCDCSDGVLLKVLHGTQP